MTEEERGSIDGTVKVTEDKVINDEARCRVTLEELIQAASNGFIEPGTNANRDLVKGARKEKRSLDEVEPAAATEEAATSKRIKGDINDCCDKNSSCVYHQPGQQAKDNRSLAKPASSSSQSSGPPSASKRPVVQVAKKPVTQAEKNPPSSIVRASVSSCINDELSLLKSESYGSCSRHSKGGGDSGNANKRQAEMREDAQATTRSRSCGISEINPSLPKTAISKKPLKEPIERRSGIHQIPSRSSPDTMGSSILAAPLRPSSVSTASENSVSLPTALKSAGVTLDSSEHGRSILNDGAGARQQSVAYLVREFRALREKLRRKNNDIDPATPAAQKQFEFKSTPEFQALVDEAQPEGRDRTNEPATQSMSDLNVQGQTNARLVPANADESPKGDGIALGRPLITPPNKMDEKDEVTRTPALKPISSPVATPSSPEEGECFEPGRKDSHPTPATDLSSRLPPGKKLMGRFVEPRRGMKSAGWDRPPRELYRPGYRGGNGSY